jgi:hypothetical protein
MLNLVLHCAAGASLALYLCVFAWCAAHRSSVGDGDQPGDLLPLSQPPAE